MQNGTINQYTIIFEENGGTTVSSVTEDYGTKIDTQPATTKDNYVFDGWYSDESFSDISKVTFPYTIEANDTLFAKWTAIDVTGITLSEEEVTYAPLETGFVTATITPSDATNKQITVTNLNSTVATAEVDIIDPTKINITALQVGRTEIAVTTDDGGFTDKLIVNVVSSDNPSADTQKGNMEGTLTDANGAPLAGYYITLHSTPITIVTNSSGEFSFGKTYFADHTLIVEDSTRREVARFDVSMQEGSANNAAINNLARTINITYTHMAVRIRIDLQAADPAASSFDVLGVSFENYIAPNPQTGDSSGDNNIIMWLASFALLAFLGVNISKQRKRLKVNDKDKDND